MSGAGVREARLRPDHAERYPGIEPGIWFTAATLAEHLNIRRASSGWGSDAAIIDAMAQIGLPSATALSVCHTIVVAIATLIAKRMPSRCDGNSPNRFISASA